MNMKNYKIIKRPVLSEKSLKDASNGEYTFEVDLKANKKEIAKAVGEAFGVDVKSVRTRIAKGKRVRLRGRSQEREGEKIKKASVKLPTGEKIAGFDVSK